MNIIEGLSFNDVLLMPKYSTHKSRGETDISVQFPKEFKFELPFTPSNMASVTELGMAKTFYNHKSLANLHRFCEFEKQLEWLEEVKTWHDGTRYVSFSVGVKEEDYNRVDQLVACGSQIILIDIAHGWSEHCLAMIRYIADKYPNVLLIAGNVACGNGACDLWNVGADVVKGNCGSGSMCSTRIRTGCGAPAILTLQLCRQAKLYMEQNLNKKLGLIQDGGAVHSGDVAKALALADMYMGGSLFAGTDEAPGDLIEKEVNGKIKKYKKYVGSSTHKDTYKEGVESLKEYQGSVNPIIEQLCEGIRSCCSYNGAFNLEELKQEPQWIKITAAGYRESAPHDYDVLSKG